MTAAVRRTPGALGRRIRGGDAVLLLAAAVIAMSVVLSAASAGPASLDDRARAIDSQLRCPTCQGLSIADSPATAASQMRAIVREQLAAGASDDDVRAFFVARYGRWILLDPPLAGPDLALWLAPAAILAGGALLVVRRTRGRETATAARRWRAVPSVPVPGSVTLALAGAMALALAVPIAAAVGPRLAGLQVSGGQVAPGSPSIADLEAVVRAQPGDAAALVALGDALLVADRPGDAAARYQAALALDPTNVQALLGVGTVLLGADRPDAAGPVFDRVLALLPDQPDALLYRAIARLRIDGAVTDPVRRDLRRFLEVTLTSDPRRQMAASLLASPAPSIGSPAAPSAAPPS